MLPTFFLCSAEERAVMAELILILVREPGYIQKTTVRREWRLRPSLNKKKKSIINFHSLSLHYPVGLQNES